jgi:acyl carrier protein
MTDSAVHDGVQAVFRQVFHEEELTLEPGIGIHTLEDWDSARHVELLVAIERRFGVTFRLSELHTVRTVTDIERVVTQKLGHGAA